MSDQGCESGLNFYPDPILEKKNPDPGPTLKNRDEDPGLAKKTDSGALYTSNEGRFLKGFKANILDNFKSNLFRFHAFGVRRTIDVLDPENQPGSGAPGLTGIQRKKLGSANLTRTQDR